MYKGIPQNDIGMRTDVLDNISKSIGMKMLVRSMSPKVVVADEIGTIQDIDAIEYAITSGVKGIFTAHGSSLQDIMHNPILGQLLTKNIIERILYINSNREISLIYENKERQTNDCD